MTIEDRKKAKEANVQSLKDFKIPDALKNQVEHTREDLIVFAWHGQRIDLRKLTPERMLKLAKNPKFPVLNLIEGKEAKKEKAAEPTPKTTSSSQTSDDKDAGKKAGK